MGTGYLQQGFETYCTSCSCRIDRQGLAVLKLARDIALTLRPQNASKYGDKVSIAYVTLSSSLPCSKRSNISEKYAAEPFEQLRKQWI